MNGWEVPSSKCGWPPDLIGCLSDVSSVRGKDLRMSEDKISPVAAYFQSNIEVEMAKLFTFQPSHQNLRLERKF